MASPDVKEDIDLASFANDTDINPEIVDFTRIEKYKTNIVLWSVYDMANTIYSMGIVSWVILPLITIVSIAGVAGVDPYTIISGQAIVSEEQFKDGSNYANFVYFIVVLIGNLIMVVVSPLLGAYADQLYKRKYLLASLTVFCLIFIYSISLQLNLMWILTLFLLSNLAYQMSLIVYDSMIRFVAKPGDVGKASGFGVAIGYMGSFIALGIAFYMAGAGNDFILNEERFAISIGYIPEYIPLVALSFFILGFPILFITEARIEGLKKSFTEIKDETIRTLKSTLSEIANVKDSKYFMIGWLLFTDTANVTIAYMNVLVILGLRLPASTVILVLGIGIGSAVIFTYPVGWMGDKIGPKKTFNVVALLWLLSLTFGFLTNLPIGGIVTPTWFAYIMAVIVGPALGGTWVAQRSMISQLAPANRTSNYFGVANIFGRISSILGPAIVTASIFTFTEFLDLSVSLSYRLVMAVIAGLLIVGLSIINRVEDHHEKYLEGYRHVGDGKWVDLSKPDKDSSKFLE